MRSARGVAVRLKSERSQGNVTDWPSTLPPCPILRAVIGRVVAAGADHVERMWCEMSDKPTGVAASQATAADIGIAMQAFEGFEPVKLPQWELVGKETDGTPIYRNNWGEYNPWSSIYEKMPPYGKSVLTWDGKNLAVTTWFESEHGFDRQGVTHWMPLPAPPTDAK